MTRAKQFIKDYTKRCSNELIDGGYHEWMSPDTALRACEIAQEELIERACEWFEKNYHDIGLRWMRGYDVDEWIDDFKQAMQ